MGKESIWWLFDFLLWPKIMHSCFWIKSILLRCISRIRNLRHILWIPPYNIPLWHHHTARYHIIATFCKSFRFIIIAAVSCHCFLSKCLLLKHIISLLLLPLAGLILGHVIMDIVSNHNIADLSHGCSAWLGVFMGLWNLGEIWAGIGHDRVGLVVHLSKLLFTSLCLVGRGLYLETMAGAWESVLNIVDVKSPHFGWRWWRLVVVHFCFKYINYLIDLVDLLRI